jgi:uncharacterized protein YuzE
MNQTYDSSTDSLYLEVRPLPSRRTVEIEEDVFLDLGEDGDPVGYDIQHGTWSVSPADSGHGDLSWAMPKGSAR